MVKLIKRLAFCVAASVVMLAASPAHAVQGICMECQWASMPGKWICYYVNWDASEECFQFPSSGCGSWGTCSVN
jgi:hypothetical protein